MELSPAQYKERGSLALKIVGLAQVGRRVGVGVHVPGVQRVAPPGVLGRPA